MNLYAYDAVEPKFEQGTWINPNYKKLYSTDISPRLVYSFAVRFNTTTNNNDYYIVLSDKPIEDRQCYRTIYTKHNITILDLKPIWEHCNLKKLTKKDYINIEHIEHSDDGDIYHIDV